MLDELLHLDQTVFDQSQALHWGPLTALFIVASAWWVKGLAFVAAGAIWDVFSRRRFPTATLSSAALAFGIASALVMVIKDLADRARPAVADPTFQALAATPESASFPSGHAATAFAAAAAVCVFCPRLRWPLFALATLVAVSRVYLGVHYWLDVLAGAALGILIGVSVAWALRRIGNLLPRPLRA